MRTFSHLFGEHCTAEARCLSVGTPDQSQHQENAEPGIDVTLETQSAPDVIYLRGDSAEGLEDNARFEALDRMERASKEEQRQAELQNTIEAEVEALVADIKDMSDAQRGEHVRKFNAEVLNPLGKTLSIIAGKPRISEYTPKGPEDPRILMKKMKIQQLSAEIHGLEKAMFNMRAQGISRFGQEYIDFTKSMRRRGNVAPEIARAMRGEIAPQVKPAIDAWKNIGIQLSQKIAELEAVKLTPWQSMPLPAPAQAPAPTQPLREQSAPRFDRRVPVDRLEFTRDLATLDPETQELIKSLSPEFQQSIGSIAPFLNEQEKSDLGSLTEKLANGEFNAKVSAQLFNLDGTLRTPEEIRAEIASHPTEAKAIEVIATFIESLSPGEKKVMELLIKQAQQLNQGRDSRNFSSPEQIARYTDTWMKVKEKGDEPGMEIAEGLLLMQGVEIDDKGKITPLEDGFGGKGMGFIMGLIMVVDGFLKKIGEKMERKKKKEVQKDEAPIEEITEEKKNEEIQKSEKRIGELKKEQTDFKDTIKKGEEELAKEPVGTKHVLQMKLDNLKKDLKKVEEELEKEEKKLKKLKEAVSKPVSQEQNVERTNSKLEKFNTNKGALKKKMREQIKERISKLDPENPTVGAMRDELDDFLRINDASIDAMHLEMNKDGKYRITYDISSFIKALSSKYPNTNKKSSNAYLQEMKVSIEKAIGIDAPAYGLHEEDGKLVTNWVSAEMIEKLDSIIPQSAQ